MTYVGGNHDDPVSIESVVWEYLQAIKPGKVTKKDEWKLILESISVDTWMGTTLVYSLGKFFSREKGNICNDIWKAALCIHYQHCLEIIRNG